MGTPTLLLRSLDLSNFRGFVGQHHLDFPDRGLVAVIGRNENTEGSSGAGKTSVVEGPAFAFDYGEFSATDLQSWDWLTKDPLAVEVEFTCQAGDVVLRRGKKPSIRVGTQPAVTSAKEVAAKLREVVGIPPHILKALTYRPQKKPGLFLDMRDGEKKSFLTEVLGLGQFEAEVDRVQKVITALERDLEVKNALLAEHMACGMPEKPAEPVLNDERQFEVAVEQAQQNLDKARVIVQNLRTQEQHHRDQVDVRIAAAQFEHGPKVHDAEQLVVSFKSLYRATQQRPLDPEPDPLKVLRQKLDYLREGIRKLRADHLQVLMNERSALQGRQRAAQDLRNRCARKEDVKREVQRLTLLLDGLKAKKCAMCQRDWEDQGYHDTVAKAKQDLAAACGDLASISESERKYQECQATLKEQEQTVKVLEAKDPVPANFIEMEQKLVQTLAGFEAEMKQSRQLELADIRTQIANAETRVSEAKRARTEAVEQAQQMTPAHDDAVRAVGAAREVEQGLEREVSACQNALRLARMQNQEWQRGHLERLDQYTRAMKRIEVATAHVEEAQTKLQAEQDYQAMVRGFLSLIFDETLTRVATLTNQRLARIPNVESLTLHFTSEHHTKTAGNLRQEIRPVVEKNGHVIPLKAGCSGGMYTAVELAVDLSLADVIAERTGVMPGWLVLDEAFDGLDLVAKKACLEMLKEAAEQRLILVIDHATEVKEQTFDHIITVVQKDDRSRFE